VIRIFTGQKWLQPWIVPLLVGAGVFFLVASTSSHYGLTLDEPNYFQASDLELQWFGEFFRGILQGDPGSVLNDEKIESAWRWDPYLFPPPFRADKNRLFTFHGQIYSLQACPGPALCSAGNRHVPVDDSAL